MRTRLQRFWALVRQLSTDDAYERYVAHQDRDHPGRAVLTRREFYWREQEHKWHGIKRCC